MMFLNLSRETIITISVFVKVHDPNFGLDTIQQYLEGVAVLPFGFALRELVFSPGLFVQFLYFLLQFGHFL